MKTGDLVKLKSGGPVMTVESIHANDLGLLVFTQWFVRGELHFAKFMSGCLVKAKAGRRG